MNEEDGFLSAIRQQPADDTARLVYADWLDERGDPPARTKADFIRLELQLSAAPEPAAARVRRLKSLLQLAANLPPEWLIVVSGPEIECCDAAEEVGCPGRWDRLTPTADPTARRCTACRHAVRYCATLPEAESHFTNGERVAVSLALPRRFARRRPQPPPPRFLSPQRRLGPAVPDPVHRLAGAARRKDPE